MTYYDRHRTKPVQISKQFAQLADSDDQNIEGRIFPVMTAMHIRAYLQAPEPYLELEMGFLNASVFTVVFDHVEGPILYHGYPLQTKAEIAKPLSIGHGDSAILVLRQPVTVDAARMMQSEVLAKPGAYAERFIVLEMGRFAVWLTYGGDNNRKLVRKAFPDRVFSACHCD